MERSHAADYSLAPAAMLANHSIEVDREIVADGRRRTCPLTAFEL